MKVSIVIPAYNEEKYISKCIKTLLNQSYKNFEIVIIDDGSRDKTVEIVKQFIKKHKNIILLHQKHGGPGRGRNLGVKHSKGEIIVLVDADMEFDKDYIKKLIKPIIKRKAIGTYHIKEYVANKENVWARSWGTKRVGDSPGEKISIFRAILKKEFLRAGGFDPSTGAFDDQSLKRVLGDSSLGVDAVCHHNNPTTLSEAFDHSRWVGGSFITNPDAIKRHVKRFCLLIIPSAIILIIAAFILIFYNIMFFIFLLIISPILISILLTIRRTMKEPDISLFFALPIFYSTTIIGFGYGALTQLLNIIISRIKREKISYKY